MNKPQQQLDKLAAGSEALGVIDEGVSEREQIVKKKQEEQACLMLEALLE